jgi:pimeloyl-ACP methyl ester carboxylesterase
MSLPNPPLLNPLSQTVLPPGVRARFVDNGNGLSMHVLEAGWDDHSRPCLLLLHGFPELAYSWRALLKPLADAGYHVVAPDQRGYGRTTGWTDGYDADLAPFRMINLVRDALGLVNALGRRAVDCVIGHDFGSPVAGWCATIRPDVFRSVVMMSAPFAGPPALPVNGRRANARDRADPIAAAAAAVHVQLAHLPRPRKHYQWYYSEAAANADMLHCPQGLFAFLRAYYHVKSADWPDNKPRPLTAWSAEELAKLPTYYVMDRGQTMPATVAPNMPSAAQIAACQWLTDAQLQVYADEFARTGFQGSLNWYRCRTSGRFVAEEQLFGGRTIDVPACFIAGKSDWGTYQKAGELERLQSTVCTRFADTHLVDGAGHWVQQEQPQRVLKVLLDFLRRAAIAK